MSDGNFADKLAVVTAVSLGLGRAVAAAYIQAAAAVPGAARRRDLREDPQTELGADGFAFTAAGIAQSPGASEWRRRSTASGRWTSS